MDNEKIPEDRRRAIAVESSDSFEEYILERFEPIDLFPSVARNNMPFNYFGFPGDAVSAQKDPIIKKERDLFHDAVVVALFNADVSGRPAVDAYIKAAGLYYKHCESGHRASMQFEPSVVSGWSDWVESL